MYHNKLLDLDKERLYDSDVGTCMVHADFMVIDGEDCWYLDVGDASYRYTPAEFDGMLEDLATLVDESGLDVADHYLLKTYAFDSVKRIELVKAEHYSIGDLETFPMVVHSNQSVSPLLNHGPYHNWVIRRRVGQKPYYVYRTHPELGFKDRPFIIKDGHGEDIGDRFKNLELASAFLDGMCWAEGEPFCDE